MSALVVLSGALVALSGRLLELAGRLEREAGAYTLPVRLADWLAGRISALARGHWSPTRGGVLDVASFFDPPEAR